MMSEENSEGIACPKCGCRHLEYSYGKDAPAERMRVKRCRHCGTRVMTSEVVKRILPPPLKTGRKPSQPEDVSVYRMTDARKAI